MKQQVSHFAISLPFLSLAVLVALLAPGSLGAQCTCDTIGASICGGQGFQITLTGFSSDALNGTSSWDYSVCNAPETGCVPPKDLSHIDIDLPGLGACLTPDQVVSVRQLGSTGGNGVMLTCGVSEKDPSCDNPGTVGLDFVAKCDVVSNLDPGECATFRITIAGEMPTLGPGVASTVTKAGPGCVGDCILGPSCSPCIEPPLDRCLTRTAGFWGTHPAVTAQFLPVTVCGETLSGTAAGSCDSVTEALCVAPGRELKGMTSYAQMVRQLAAAKLNLQATDANNGTCGTAVNARIAACEALCGASDEAIALSGCIEDLASFNESQDTFPITPAPFNSPGSAAPASCQKANGNGIVIGKKSCQ
jgi:hypothetical protein